MNAQSKLLKSRQYQTVHPWLVFVDICPAAMKVYIMLLFHARGDESAMPKVATIATDMGCSPGTVREYLRELDREGLIERVPRYDERNGAQIANDYILYNDVVPPTPKSARAELDPEQPQLIDPSGDTPPVEISYRGGVENSDRAPIGNLDTLINAESPLTQEERVPPTPKADPMEKHWARKTAADHAEDDEEDFRRLVAVYPERAGDQGHNGAKELLIHAIKSGAGVKAILDGAELYRKAMEAEGSIGTKFVMKLSSWLEKRGWTDVIKARAPDQPSKGKRETQPDSIADLVRKFGGE